MSRPAPDLFTDIRRMQEEIRQLRLRPVGAAGPWELMHDYLYPGYQVNDSNDLDDDNAARYYIAGERVYLGGSVILSRADLGASPDYAIANPLPFSSPREIALGHAEENQNLSNTGWISRTFGVYLTSIFVLSGGVDDEIPDGTAISLEPFSYRITP